MALTIQFLEGQAPGWYWWSGVNEVASGREIYEGPFYTARSCIEDYIQAFESEQTVEEIAKEAGVEEEI